MPVDPAFKGVGQKPGMDIWRIEKLKVVPVPKNLYGSFYSGDSYICLSTKKDDRSDKLDWDIHFWQGEETSTDEAGISAYKTVELDDSLGGAPVQHRETQEHESAEFLSYFKKGIQYLEGGIESGFKHVEEEKNIKRLFRVKGKKQVRVRQVAAKCESLNTGDCFILDTGDIVYQWNGPEANRMEKIKAAVATRKIRDEDRKGKAKIKIIEILWDSDPDFFKALGNKCKIKKASEVKSDVEHEKQASREVRLFRITDESGTLKCLPVQAAPLTQNYLDSSDTFMLDTGAPESGIFCWIGKSCTKKEKEFAMMTAPKYLREREYPAWTKVTTVIDGGETPTFKQFFKDWRDPESQRGLGQIYHRHQIAKNYPDVDIDVELMHSRHAGLMPGLMPDEGKGKLEVWRVIDLKLQPVKTENYGRFFGGDSYVVKYEATNKEKDIIIYYWLGKQSSVDEKETAQRLANKMDDDLGGAPITVRINQGKEPEHFLRIFQGKIIIFMGGHESGFKGLQHHDTYDPKGSRLFHIRGTNEINTRAVQVKEKATELNTNDVFVLESGKNTWVWFGKGASDSEKKMGKEVTAKISANKITEITEGNESADFWKALGGKASYDTTPETGVKPIIPARLFHLSNASGKLKVEEIKGFTQDDLDPDDVMLLDVNDSIFIWVGEGADEQEKKEAEKVAQEYVTADPSPRVAEDVTIVSIKQSRELPYFTCNFESWDKDYFKKLADWEKMKADMEA